MEKQIRAHLALVENKLAWLRAQVKKTKTGQLSAAAEAELKNFLKYHRLAMRNFQHERLVHLLVMLFFGIIVMVAAGMTILLYPAIYYFRLGPATVVGVWLLLALVAVTEGFYIKHYYFLENKIQQLYRLERQFFELQAA
jgi:hypothetical protein